jgi:DinB family protein
VTQDDALRVLAVGWRELREALEAVQRAGIRLTHSNRRAWSLLDLAGHLEGWERLAIELIEDRRSGAAPLRLDAVLNGQPGAVDAYNARVIEANRATPAAELLERAEDTCDELAAAIGGLSDAEWSALVPNEIREPVSLGVALGLVLGAPGRPFGHASAHRGDFEGMKPGSLPG